MCFSFLMFSLSRPCELLFLLGFIASWTCAVVIVMLYPCILCIFGLVKQFAIFLGVVFILLLNVMELLSVDGSALLDIKCMVIQRVCVLCLWSQCASRCSFHMFVYVRCLRFWELDYRYLLSICYFFVWICILCGRVGACSCYESWPFVYCVFCHQNDVVVGQRRCGGMSVCVVSLCVDGRLRYLYIMLGGYLCIFSAPSVQWCCTSASYHIFICGRYR